MIGCISVIVPKLSKTSWSEMIIWNIEKEVFSKKAANIAHMQNILKITEMLDAIWDCSYTESEKYTGERLLAGLIGKV
jgi:hypothetical protein